jgi:diaminohydroxyphosphoribosylaminopyrimidine deaminase / 5-amino-6-(5-phosphoribosylamino)uracil reductase
MSVDYDVDARWMRRCVELARRGAGRTAPNPMVGALLVRDGEVLAEGWTQPPGQDHAEPDALKKLPDSRAPGATMYVSLEPCCFYGRTPPCTDYLLASGVTRVVVGMVDPHPNVQGEGLRILRNAGIQVDVGVEEAACRDLNAGFVKANEHGLPRVWLKAAATLDGRIADAGGKSRWITGAEARQEGHRMRDRSDAILVGSGTLLADDPALTTRGVEGGRDALRVVLDTELRCPADARLLQVGSAPPVIYCASDAPERELAATIVRVPRTDDGLDLDVILRDLVKRGVHNLLVEGGGRTLHSFLAAGLADRLLLFLAPKVLAGGTHFLEGAPFSLGEGPSFELLHTRRLGQDLLLDLQVQDA